MSEINLNLANVKPQEMKQDTSVETGGILASNTPSPLFSAAPSTETGGSIASAGGSSSSVGLNVSC